MRLLTAILTLYIFSMSLQLCDDCFREERCDDDSGVASVTITLNDADNCSSGCVFSCCQAYACEERSEVPAARQTVSDQISPALPQWDTHYHRKYSETIWQPPKA